VTSAGTPGTALPGAQSSSRIDWPGWRTPCALVGILLIGAWLFWPSTDSLLHEWLDVPASAYRHGLLVVAITAWLAIRAVRARAARPAAEPRLWLPLVLLGAASITWLVAWRSGIQVAHQALVPAVLWLAIWCSLGRRVAEATAVPMALLYSAIPVWHILVPALQSATVFVVSVLLRVLAIPAYVVGDLVYIPSGAFHVEEGCAGLHYFIVAATIGVLYGELREDRWRTRASLLALCLGLALVSNWLRVVIIVIAGHLTDMQHYLVRVDHATFGWVTFAVAMIVFVLVARAWPAAEAPLNAPPTAAATRTARGALIAAGLAALVAAIGPAWGWIAPVRAAAAPNLSLPASLAGWSGPADTCQGAWRPQFPTADLQVRREFSRDGARVCLFAASYLSQHQGKELIGYSTSVAGEDGDVVAMNGLESEGRQVRELRLGGDLRADQLVWYGYVVGRGEMTRGVEAQLRYALASLHGAPAASVFAIGTPCVPDCAAARRRLGEVLPHVRVGAESAD
jgi:EpsI family protein